MKMKNKQLNNTEKLELIEKGVKSLIEENGRIAEENRIIKTELERLKKRVKAYDK